MYNFNMQDKSPVYAQYSIIMAGGYAVFPIAAVVYKFFTMPPDKYGYFTLLWNTVLLGIAHAGFVRIVKEYKRTPFFVLHLVFFLSSGLAAYLLLWKSTPDPLFMAVTFFWVGVAGRFLNQKKRWTEKKTLTVVTLYLALTIIIYLGSLRFVIFLHNFRDYDTSQITRIQFFEYRHPIDFSSAQPLLEIDDIETVNEFLESLGDTYPFTDRLDREAKPTRYIVSVYKQNGSATDFVLAKMVYEGQQLAYINFMTESSLTKGYGLYSNGSYQNARLHDMVMGKIKPGKWLPEKEKK